MHARCRNDEPIGWIEPHSVANPRALGGNPSVQRHHPHGRISLDVVQNDIDRVIEAKPAILNEFAISQRVMAAIASRSPAPRDSAIA